MKTCKDCGQTKPLSEFGKKATCRDGHDTLCRPCKNAALKAWRAANREHRNAWHVQNRRKRKAVVMERLGGRCVCCGETELVFLTIDHVEGGGTAERRTRKEAYTWERVKKEGYPEGRYQVLCWNCNAAKHFDPLGCPHQRR